MAGLEATQEFSDSNPDSEAEPRLELLEDCKHAGDFDDSTPQRQLAFCRRYYGLTREAAMSASDHVGPSRLRGRSVVRVESEASGRARGGRV